MLTKATATRSRLRLQAIIAGALVVFVGACGERQENFAAQIPPDSIAVSKRELDQLKKDQDTLKSLVGALRGCTESAELELKCFVSAAALAGVVPPTASERPPQTAEEPIEETKNEPSAWLYDERIDEMTGKISKTACVLSDEPVYFDFPYGTQTARLCLRDHPKYGKDVFIAFDKAQFLCGYDGCRVSVKFGQNKPVTFDGIDPADHSSDTLFLAPFNRFLSGVRKAETTLVEAQFFQEGDRQMKFHTSGLVWK